MFKTCSVLSNYNITFLLYLDKWTVQSLLIKAQSLEQTSKSTFYNDQPRNNSKRTRIKDNNNLSKSCPLWFLQPLFCALSMNQKIVLLSLLYPFEFLRHYEMKLMANSRKQSKKCHFNLKRQNNEVSITKNQMVAKKKKKEMTYSNMRGCKNLNQLIFWHK